MSAVKRAEPIVQKDEQQIPTGQAGTHRNEDPIRNTTNDIIGILVVTLLGAGLLVFATVNPLIGCGIMIATIILPHVLVRISDKIVERFAKTYPTVLSHSNECNV